MINNEKEIKEQKTLCMTVCALISYLSLTSFINDVFNLFVGEGFIYDTMVCYVILWFLIIKSLLIVVKNIKKDVLILTIFLYVMWRISDGLYPGNHRFMIADKSGFLTDPFYILFVCAFSGYIFSRYITDFEMLEKMLLKFALAAVIASTISFFLTRSKIYQKQYMVFSYNMLIHVAFLIIYYFEHKKKAHLFVGLWGALLMFMAGCRGALICCIGSFIVYLLFRKVKLAKKLAAISILCVFLYILMMNFESVMSWLAHLAEFLNIDSRTIKLIESGDFLNESGRDVIQERIVAGFNMFGHGLFGDRVLTGGSYAHNFAVEIIAQFGYIFGIPILAVVFLLLLQGVFARDKHLRNLIIIFLSAGIFKLFFSSSYLNQEPCFYILLGLCVNSIKHAEYKKSIDKNVESKFIYSSGNEVKYE